MKLHSIDQPSHSEDADGLLQERQRIVRFCARFTGDVDAAEDLAQQTLLEAWQHAQDLRNPAARHSWLFGIARNVCLLWARRRVRGISRLVDLDDTGSEAAGNLADWLASDVDLEVELERDELARLLDRAMAFLPPATRAVLVERYIEETPQAEVAARLGLSEGAVEARLRRGKLALRRVLMTDLRDEAISYDLIASDTHNWQATRIWCPVCGQAHLNGCFAPGTQELMLRCPTCTLDPSTHILKGGDAALFGGIRSFRPALSRFLLWGNSYYQRGIVDRAVQCVNCGSSVPFRIRWYEDVLPPMFKRGARLECMTCAWKTDFALAGIVMCLPEARRFWREHPRMFLLPEREVELVGQAALVTRLQSMTCTASLDVVCARDTFEVMGVYGAGA
jgi:RNA polymerase sigma-70 factor (ECF subfamily)